MQVQASDTCTPARRAKRMKAEVDQVHYSCTFARTLPQDRFNTCLILLLCYSYFRSQIRITIIFPFSLLSSLAVGSQRGVQEERCLRTDPISGDGWALL